MKNIIQFSIEKGQDGYFVATANDFSIITQAKSLENLFANIKEATELFFEENFNIETLISRTPSIFINLFQKMIYKNFSTLIKIINITK